MESQYRQMPLGPVYIQVANFLNGKKEHVCLIFAAERVQRSMGNSIQVCAFKSSAWILMLIFLNGIGGANIPTSKPRATASATSGVHKCCICKSNPANPGHTWCERCFSIAKAQQKT